MSEWLPPLILLNDYNGSWDLYLAAVYAQFHKDFVESKPMFREVRLGLKRFPIEQEKESTFWHLMSEGKVEADRLPDIRRCERMGWPRPIIEQEVKRNLPVWNQPRYGEARIAIGLKDFSYVLILAPRQTVTGLMYLPWTAFFVEYEHQRAKFKKQWEKDPYKG